MSSFVLGLKKFANWLKENPWAIIVALISVFGAYALMKRKNNKIANLKDAVAVQAIKSKIAVDDKEAQRLADSAESREPEVRAIDERIAASKRRIVEINEGGANLKEKSDEDIAALFGDSGL